MNETYKQNLAALKAELVEHEALLMMHANVMVKTGFHLGHVGAKKYKHEAENQKTIIGGLYFDDACILLHVPEAHEGFPIYYRYKSIHEMKRKTEMLFVLMGYRNVDFNLNERANYLNNEEAPTADTSANEDESEDEESDS
jgi:hypothetical protein